MAESAVVNASPLIFLLRIPVRGTLGLTLIAKQRGHISSARRVLEQLRQGGMFLSDEVINRALALVGE